MPIFIATPFLLIRIFLFVIFTPLLLSRHPPPPWAGASWEADGRAIGSWTRARTPPPRTSTAAWSVSEDAPDNPTRPRDGATELGPH
eukprot:332488-Pyramimonas_sp.AAC.1